MNLIISFGNFLFRWRDPLFSLFFLGSLYALTIKSDFFLLKSFGGLEHDYFFSFLGLILILKGLVFRTLVIGFIYIKRAGMRKQIHAEQLHKEGFFAHSRNPLYLGNLLIITGGVFSFNSYLHWFLILPFFYFVYYAIIKAEEDYLTKKFQNEYLEYKKQVPMLILGNWKAFPSSFSNLRFSLKRALRIEHSVHSYVLFTFVLINIFKFHFRYDFSWESFLIKALLFTGGLILFYQVLLFLLKKFRFLEDHEKPS
ncbi:MAG: hypothetical protein NZ853_06000 [Leptospiraceae bacterium]|nr:hypothetical protein [Leptospiraceae bacterium]MDW7976497.1 methyltransferase [Leptospiraceae bacterium]